MATNFQGKVAFVTGGSRGIGAAVVRRLADGGAAVAFTFKGSRAAAEDLVAEIEASGGRALALHADAGDAAALTQAVNEAALRFGRIDILVNNAGVFSMASIADIPVEEFDRMLNVNVRAVFIASQAALAHMGEGGRIINIGSCNAERMPFAGGATYAMSKAALVGLVKGMARDLGPRGITVNNVQPGPTNTDMNPAAGDFAGAMHDLMALKRHARPEEIAAMVAYVASEEAGFVTGASLTIDGGFNA
ncbi:MULTISPECIES: SDR family oxidoreductase [Pandoraea]|jgi:3-oxoacyl-[acyl-carrier protein] reductase|uniref:Oxidoreductase n=1 Tax=Pandoraea pnomenusa TaxID=93220 RepID=A0ABY6WI96_9BURK|nr:MULTISPECIES: SDR family oxidoreductase [Pandoraea]AHB04712.1 oxidoreductase [Pandoraea pnomenusa 3kgm]AHB74895.1 oxidoreductase [Pandoraea pnomenusa]AHN76734.1 oxidoreductase [Pandoraea pnomenusa]ANC43868.1 oxidoreductase [Pandoraea pnomenusa]QDX23074.1 SDR family oxidoreductase [Pandoraea pnomenusa]